MRRSPPDNHTQAVGSAPPVIGSPHAHTLNQSRPDARNGCGSGSTARPTARQASSQTAQDLHFGEGSGGDDGQSQERAQARPGQLQPGASPAGALQREYGVSL